MRQFFLNTKIILGIVFVYSASFFHLQVASEEPPFNNSLTSFHRDTVIISPTASATSFELSSSPCSSVGNKFSGRQEVPGSIDAGSAYSLNTVHNALIHDNLSLTVARNNQRFQRSSFSQEDRRLVLGRQTRPRRFLQAGRAQVNRPQVEEFFSDGEAMGNVSFARSYGSSSSDSSSSSDNSYNSSTFENRGARAHAAALFVFHYHEGVYPFAVDQERNQSGVISRIKKFFSCCDC